MVQGRVKVADEEDKGVEDLVKAGWGEVGREGGVLEEGRGVEAARVLSEGTKALPQLRGSWCQPQRRRQQR